MESYQIIWNKVLPELEKSVYTIHFSMLITALEPVDIVNNKLILITKTKVYVEMTKTNILDKIKEIVIKQNMGITDVEVLECDNKTEYERVKSEQSTNIEFESSPINPKYTFDNFVVGNSNRYLYAASKAVAEDPGNTYNPLFIYGASGLGKTHIMNAIANHINIHHPTKNVLYATCEKFTTDLIALIRSGKAYSKDGELFKNRYRNVDVLIIDDVQFLAKKESTQEEFFHTFNSLYGANKQIILSADCEPKDIALLDDRLKTRFEGGLKAQVLPPDIETKIAIIQKKAEQKKQIISIEVATFIAENCDENVRSLEGLLNKVIFASILKEEPISLELCMDALKDSINTENKEALTVTTIIDKVCSFYNIPKQDLLSKKRNKELVIPRQICAYLMTELMSIPLETIGQALGGKDHTTIIHSREKIAKLIKLDDVIATNVSDLKNLILKK